MNAWRCPFGAGNRLKSGRGGPRRHIQRSRVWAAVLAAMWFSADSPAAIAQNLNPAPLITQPVSDSGLVHLKGNVHPLARPEFDQGVAPSSLALERMLLVMKRSLAQQSALSRFVESQQDKSSPNYHQWLSPEQFGEFFGPSRMDVQTVISWLVSHGFRVTQISLGRTIIEFSGTAAEVQEALQTSIHKYRINGQEYWANATDPQIPAALSPAVAGIVSLHNFPRKSYARILKESHLSSGNAALDPLFTFQNPLGPGSFYGVGPGDFAAIYNSKPLLAAGIDGTGQTIAVVGETNFNIQDVLQFRSIFGLPTNFSAANVILNGPDPGITSSDEEGEADLDVQWSGAVAPGATVLFVISGSTSTTAGIDLSALYIVENNLAGVMSESYGECEAFLGAAGNAFYRTLWEQAAAQGITVVLSSGDGGSAGCDDFNSESVATGGLAVSGLASTPFNLSVGGTDFNQVNNWSSYWNSTNDATQTSARGYIPEIPWSQNCAQISLNGCGGGAPGGSVNIVAGGGGPSSIYQKPTWQMGVPGMPNDNRRDQPDIALFASPGFDDSGYIYCQRDINTSGVRTCDLGTNIAGSDFGIVGGTSASAPAFAGIMALVNQYEAAHGGSNRQGNPNYVLYALAKKPGGSCSSSATQPPGCIFNDVVNGNSVLPTGGPGVGTNSVPCRGSSPDCSIVTGSGTGVLVDPNHPSIEAWTATAGYDMSTGLGTLNVNNLATSWSTASTTSTTTTLALSPASGIVHGSGENVSINISVTANQGSGVPAGDVALIAMFPDGTSQAAGQFTLNNGTIAATQTHSLPGGTFNLVAHYAGDGTNAPSDSNTVPVTVAPEASSVLASLVTFDINGRPTNFAATSTTYGSGYYLFRIDVGEGAASISPATGISSNCSRRITNCPTGVLAVTINGISLTGGLPLNSAGFVEYRALAPGDYTITVSYPGDSSYGPSMTITNLSIARAPTQAFASLLGVPVQYGENMQIAADITSNSDGVAPTGTFSFFLDGAPISTPPLSYEGFPYEPKNSPPQFATLSGTTITQFVSLGNHTLAAQYSGDTYYGSSMSAPSAFTVTQAQPSFSTWGDSPNTINLGESTTLTGTILGGSAGLAPTGTFTFFDNNTAISGTVTYTTVQSTNLSLSSYSGTLTYTPTTPGSRGINVKYSGDVNYLPVSPTSGSVLTVIGPDFSIMSSGETVQTVMTGQTAIFPNVLTVSALNGFSSRVDLTCSLPARLTSCVVNPPFFSSASGTASVMVTTSSTGLLPPAHPDAPTLWSPRIVFSAGTLALLAFLVLRLGTLPRLRWLGAFSFLLVLVCFLLPITSCGGSTSNSGSPPPPSGGTPPGIYTISVNAQSGALLHSTTLTLTVTK